MAQEQTYTVGTITRYIKHRLEQDPILHDFWVTGEISNLTQHGSGHVYFSIKDEEAQLSCAMFKNVAMYYQRKLPKHGAKVRLRGEISVYPPRGSYQMIVRELELAGEGDLHRKFLELKEKLAAEGLFDPAHKRSIPAFPKCIAILTSPTGAVIRDIIDTVGRRFPHVKLLLIPTAVQGEAATASILKSLRRVEQIVEVDTVILARGGGSLEDLWCFNDEAVARAIFAMEKPIISGVGHETDVTIADFVADVRAATPTAAAELAVPNASDIQAGLDAAAEMMGSSLLRFVEIRAQLLDDLQSQMANALHNQVARHQQQLDNLGSQILGKLLHTLDFKRQELDDKQHRLQVAALQSLQEKRNLLDKYELQMQHFDYRSAMERGFSLTLKDGKPVTSASTLEMGDQVELIFHKGRAKAEINGKEEN